MAKVKSEKQQQITDIEDSKFVNVKTGKNVILVNLDQICSIETPSEDVLDECEYKDWKVPKCIIKMTNTDEFYCYKYTIQQLLDMIRNRR